jgi:F like protein
MLLTATTIKERVDIKSARVWREFDTFVRRQAVRFETRAASILASEGLRAAEAYEEYGEAAALDAAEIEEWRRYVSRVWLSTVPAAGELVTLALKAPQAVLVAAAANWLKANGAARAGQITRTSQEGIARQIRIGIEKRESKREIARRIREHYRSITPERAKTIARTEVHAASNYGSLAAAEAEREPMEKVWIATPDGRARDAHIAAGGQRRHLDTPFRVGGEALQHPGDPTLGASAGNLVNCRCFLRYVRVPRGPQAPYRVRPRTRR